MKTPQIRIYFSWLLQENVSAPLQELWGKDGKPLEDQATLETYAANYRHAWLKFEPKIVSALTDCLDITFYKDVIDVPCASWILPMSDPVIISFRNLPDQFVDVLTHELCHVLLTDNDVYSMKSSAKQINLAERWAKLFGAEHDFTTLVHIPVHALCKYIYLNVLKDPKRLDRDMKDVAENAPYKTAWDYVNSHDYIQIIEQLKQDYWAIANDK